MTPFEVVFIFFAAAFALDEYTASKEHGWESECFLSFSCFVCLNLACPVYIASVRPYKLASHFYLTSLVDLERIRHVVHNHLHRLRMPSHQRPREG